MATKKTNTKKRINLVYVDHSGLIEIHGKIFSKLWSSLNKKDRIIGRNLPSINYIEFYDEIEELDSKNPNIIVFDPLYMRLETIKKNVSQNDIGYIAYTGDSRADTIQFKLYGAHCAIKKGCTSGVGDALGAYRCALEKKQDIPLENRLFGFPIEKDHLSEPIINNKSKKYRNCCKIVGRRKNLSYATTRGGRL